jgi:hypothetical protein
VHIARSASTLASLINFKHCYLNNINSISFPTTRTANYTISDDADLIDVHASQGQERI